MAAIDQLTASIDAATVAMTTLNTTINAAVVDINTLAPGEAAIAAQGARIDSLTTALNSANAQLQTALNPPAPAPVPTPAPGS